MDEKDKHHEWRRLCRELRAQHGKLTHFLQNNYKTVFEFRSCDGNKTEIRLVPSARDGKGVGIVGQAEEAEEAGTLNGRHLATILWAYATMGRQPEDGLMLWLEGWIIALIGTLTAQDVATMLWAYATMGRQPGDGLMPRLERRVEVVVRLFTAQDVAKVFWAYARMEREFGGGMLRKMQDRAKAVAGMFDVQSVANMLWAYATVHHSMIVTGDPSNDDGCLQALKRRVEELAGTLKVQDVSKTLWAVSVFANGDLAVSTRSPEVVRMVQVLVDRLVALGSAACFTQVDLSQLHQFFLSCSLEEKLCVKALDGLGDLKETCRKSFVDNTLSTSETSVSRKQVSMALRRMGFSVEEEFCCPKSGYSIDMLLHDSDLTIGGKSNGGRRTWALEYDGPSHYLAASSKFVCKLPTGSTLLKRYHLQRLGYTLVSVPHWEWSAHDQTEQGQEKYLMSRLPEYGARQCAHARLAGTKRAHGKMSAMATAAAPDPVPFGWQQRVDSSLSCCHSSYVSSSSCLDCLRAAVAGPEPLPFGWEQRVDARGRTYYQDNATKTTTWKRPTAAAATTQAPAHPGTASAVQQTQSLPSPPDVLPPGVSAMELRVDPATGIAYFQSSAVQRLPVSAVQPTQPLLSEWVQRVG